MSVKRLCAFVGLLCILISGHAAAVNYAANLVHRPVIYVSSIAANGIALGVDSGCDGAPVPNAQTGLGGPCLTWDKGRSLMFAGDTMMLNGTLASPQTYGSTTTQTIGGSQVSTILNLAGTYKAVVPGSVNIISGMGTSQALAVGPSASGAAITLDGVNIRPDLNTAGAAPVGLFFIGSPFAPGYVFNMVNVTFSGWTTFAATPQRSLVMSAPWTWTGVTWNGGSVTAAAYMRFQQTGNALNIVGGSCTVSAATSANFGACLHYQNDTGFGAGTLSVSNFSTNVTTPATSGSFYDIRTIGAVSSISGGTHSCTTAAGTSSCRAISLEFATFVSGIPISGSSISNVGVTVNSNSGLPCIIGIDSINDRTLNVGPIIDGCNATGSSTVEGPILGSATNGIIRNSPVNGMSLGVGAKDCLNCQFLNNPLTNIWGLPLVDKGNNGSLFQGNTLNQAAVTGSYSGLTIETNVDTQQSIAGVTQASSGVVTVTSTAGYHVGDYAFFSGVGGMTQLNGNSYPITNVADATHFTIGVDTTAFGSWTSGGTSIIASSGGTYNGNAYTNKGATGTGKFLDWQTGNLVGLLENNIYTFVSGSLGTTLFSTSSANYTTCAAYKAAQEPTATCAGF